jgi:hypothetical protein
MLRTPPDQSVSTHQMDSTLIVESDIGGGLKHWSFFGDDDVVPSDKEDSAAYYGTKGTHQEDDEDITTTPLSKLQLFVSAYPRGFAELNSTLV